MDAAAMEKEVFLKEFGEDYGYPHPPKSLHDIPSPEFKRLEDSQFDSSSTTLNMVRDACQQAYDVRTSHGYVSVTVYGDRHKPALITYPDVGLNHASCFRGLFSYPEASSLLLHNFCIYHISPPGHQASSPAISSDRPVPSVEDLADQILVVLNYFGIDSVMCMGATAGAYILTLFALRHKERVLGLILISPLCRAPSWIEWFLNKVVSNLLYFSGMSDLVKECLIQRYFSKEARGGSEVPESDAVRTCRKLLDYVEGENVRRLLQVINRRCNLTNGVKKLKCRTIIFVGEHSPFYSEAVHMASTMDGRRSALIEVKGCGTMVTEEQPHAMLIPMEYFLMGYGLRSPSQVIESPGSALRPILISPHLLSPESMGLKLKPIRTRPSASPSS